MNKIDNDPRITQGPNFFTALVEWMKRAATAVNSLVDFAAAPTATTQPAGDSTTNVATTAFVQQELKSGAWTSGTTTLASTGGTLGGGATASYRYRKVGRTVEVNVLAIIPSNGTGSGSIAIGLPFAAAATTILYGRENSISGNALQAIVSAGNSFLTAFTYSNGYPGGNGASLLISGVYEST